MTVLGGGGTGGGEGGLTAAGGEHVGGDGDGGDRDGGAAGDGEGDGCEGAEDRGGVEVPAAAMGAIGEVMAAHEACDGDGLFVRPGALRAVAWRVTWRDRMAGVYDVVSAGGEGSLRDAGGGAASQRDRRGQHEHIHIMWERVRRAPVVVVERGARTGGARSDGV